MEKKDLDQPDAFQEAMGRVIEYARENRPKLLMASGALVLVVVLTAAYFLYASHNESEAAKLYFEARVKAMRSDPMGMGVIAPEALRAFENVTEKYSSTEAAQSARYELGSLYFSAGEYDRAIAVYKTFSDKAGREDIRRIFASFGIGYAYEAKKEYEKSLEAFLGVVNSKPGNVPEGIAYRNVARIYEEMNDREKALDYYRKALEKTKDPSALSLLKRKIALLG
jgi:tetratricopeptide (TPR) repeat protein